ncbi:RND efflux system [Klebsiella pneumoniae]|nr:RND efflux system [Klebsiella pneumoniae]
MGDRHYHHAGWGIIDPQIAGGAISDDCAASNFHYRMYPGADAETVQNTVTQVIEQNMNGIDHLMYMSSNGDSTGTATITLDLRIRYRSGYRQVQVQNKLALATPLLPQEVQQQGD